MRPGFFIWIAMLFSGASTAYGQAFSEMSPSVRGLGMGNAYSAVAPESEALFYNPANLTRVRGLNWTILDPTVGANQYESIEKFQQISGDDGIAEIFDEFYGESVWVHADFKSVVTLPYIGLGVYGASDTDINIDNPAYPNIYLNSVLDYGLVAGFALPVVPGFVDAGMTLKRITRTGSRIVLGPSAISDLDMDAIQDQLMSSGTAYSLDLGVNITSPGPLQPTLSLVWKNVGVTTFRHESGPAAPPSDRDEMHIGFAMNVDTPLISIIPAIEYRYANWENVQFGKKINFGIEIDLPLIDMRAGFHQGYYSLGAGVDMGLIRIDAATYGVELGAYPGQLEDRRYIVQATFELGFNPNFSFGGKDGDGFLSGKKSRRLKQRR